MERDRETHRGRARERERRGDAETRRCGDAETRRRRGSEAQRLRGAETAETDKQRQTSRDRQTETRRPRDTKTQRQTKSIHACTQCAPSLHCGPQTKVCRPPLVRRGDPLRFPSPQRALENWCTQKSLGVYGWLWMGYSCKSTPPPTHTEEPGRALTSGQVGG